MKTYILAAAAAGLALAGPAAASSSFNTSIAEGQYKTFSLQYDGPPPAAISGFTSTYIYAQQPGQFKTLWDIFNTMPSCAFDPSGVTNCSIYPSAKVTAIAWDDHINLYIEFTAKSFDNCATSPSNSCSIVYQPASVTLQGIFGQNDYEVLSSGGGAVPEPATWAMMILGFGLAGSAMRRRAVVAA